MSQQQQNIFVEEFVRLDLNPGVEYASVRHNCHNRIRIVCEARDTHSLVDRIVYRVIGGRDHGRCFSVGPMAFALTCERVSVEEKNKEKALEVKEGSGF